MNGVNGKDDSVARRMGEQAGAADFTFGEMQMRVALAAVRRWAMTQEGGKIGCSVPLEALMLGVLLDKINNMHAEMCARLEKLENVAQGTGRKVGFEVPTT